MRIIICPGIHAPQLTQSFLSHLLEQSDQPQIGRSPPLVIPVERCPPYSSLHILRFLYTHLEAESSDCFLTIPLVFVAFSAGVVGAMGAAWGWQLLGGTVRALIALDGWGVLLQGNFPIYRLSHDHFTHWSSALLGAGADSFYADPAVEHLELWRSPHTTYGWHHSTNPAQPPRRTTAARFIGEMLGGEEGERGRGGGGEGGKAG